MKRRIGIGAITGFGSNAPTKLDGQPTGNQKVDQLVRRYSKSMYETFIKGTALDEGYVDAQFKDGMVKAGIEAAYMYDHEKIVVVNLHNKSHSYIETGYCRGAWGSGMCSTRRYYHEFQKKCKFTRFVDQWWEMLSPLVK